MENVLRSLCFLGAGIPASHWCERHCLVRPNLALHDAQAEGIEIELVLDFPQMLLPNASNLWKAASSEQKQRLQQVLFPKIWA